MKISNEIPVYVYKSTLLSKKYDLHSIKSYSGLILFGWVRREVRNHHSLLVASSLWKTKDPFEPLPAFLLCHFSVSVSHPLSTLVILIPDHHFM